MSKNVIVVPEQVAERKTIVYKSRIDIKEAKATAEQMKTELFRKFVFMKPKPEEIQVVSIDKYYEQYIFVDGEYSIDYSKNWVHNVQVDETMQQLTIYGEKICPASLKDSLDMQCKILQLTGTGRFKYVTKANMIFDNKWNEVDIERLPFLPFEELPENVLNQVNPKFQNPEPITTKEVELLKEKIVQRPPEILSIHSELFKVSGRSIIYKPMYSITFHNTKTKKEICLNIDAISGKTTAIVDQAQPTKAKPSKEAPKTVDSQKTVKDAPKIMEKT
ncbi:MAG: hypothetical protein WC325_10375 [Candidatus Bathyarchaeia archaeon]